MDKFLIDLNRDYTEDKFSPARLVKLEDNFPDFCNSAFVDEIEKLKPVGVIVVENENRPDLISWKAYNRVDLWWVILVYNGYTIDDLEIGMTLSYPSITDLEVIIHNLTTKAKANQG